MKIYYAQLHEPETLNTIQEKTYGIFCTTSAVDICNYFENVNSFIPLL